MSPGADRWIIFVTTGCVALLALDAGTVPKHRTAMHGLGVLGLALSRLSIAASATRLRGPCPRGSQHRGTQGVRPRRHPRPRPPVL